MGNPDECWPWMASTSGSKDHQYGQFTLNSDGKQRHVGAHVFAFESVHGEGSADGRKVCHKCDNPPCCNPAHLFLGTHADNMKDAGSKGRLSTPRPNKQKVAADDVRLMRDLVASGTLRKDVAARFGVSPGYITQIVKGIRRQYDAPLEVLREQRRAS